MVEINDCIVFDDIDQANRIAAATHCVYSPQHDHCVARVKDGELLGGVIYQGFTGASIEMHVGGFHSRWLSRNFLIVAFGYPFLQLGCIKVIGRVPAHNTRALEFDLKMGFIEEARIRDVYPEGDLLILTMRRDQCRWLNLTPRHLGAHNGEE